MKKNIKENSSQPGKTILVATPLGLPAQMNITDICRGMQTGWPQLIAATRTLTEDPKFCQTFRHSYASGKGLSIGGPAQLVSALIIDPYWLMKPSPPADVYGWSVWMTARVYEAAETISLTLGQIPATLGDKKGTTLPEGGVLVREVLNGSGGLSQVAGDIAGLANTFADYLTAIGGDLEAAQTEYQAVKTIAQTLQLSGTGGDMIKVISSHTKAAADAYRYRCHLDDLRSAAAKVTAFGVIANMRLAMRSLATAWQAGKVRLEENSRYPLKELGDIHFLQNTLKLSAASAEWSVFSDVIRNFLAGALQSR